MSNLPAGLMPTDKNIEIFANPEIFGKCFFNVDFWINITLMVMFICFCMILLRWFEERNKEKAIRKANLNVTKTMAELYPEWDTEFNGCWTMPEEEKPSENILGLK